jgi:hypothetical protein
VIERFFSIGNKNARSVQFFAVTLTTLKLGSGMLGKSTQMLSDSQ